MYILCGAFTREFPRETGPDGKQKCARFSCVLIQFPNPVKTEHPSSIITIRVLWRTKAAVVLKSEIRIYSTDSNTMNDKRMRRRDAVTRICSTWENVRGISKKEKKYT